MKTLFIAAISLLITLNALALHPTHLSVVNLTFNAESTELSYSIRLFQDDINFLIAALYHDEIFHTTDTFDLNKHTEKLDSYFQNTFEVYIANELCESEITKRDNNEYEFWFYFKVKLSTSPELVKVRNRILLDIHSDQTNLLIVSDGNNEKGYTFDLKKQEQYINLDKK